MVSHFGEVLFPSSRAFWNDEDEYETDKRLNNSRLSVRWLKSKPECIQKLIVMEGDLISFVEQSLCDKIEEVCTIDDNDKKVSVIYQVDQKIYLCIILPQFNTNNAGVLISKISKFLVNTEITSIVYRHTSQFQSTNIPNSPFLRILTTRNRINIPGYKIKPLEQPNIIYGVSAGILSYAELTGMSASLYVLYSDYFVLDSKCVELILEILMNETHWKLQDLKYAESFFSKGNLYM